MMCLSYSGFTKDGFFDFTQTKGTFDHRYMLEIQELRITNVNIYKTTCIMNVCKVYRIHTL